MRRRRGPISRLPGKTASRSRLSRRCASVDRRRRYPKDAAQDPSNRSAPSQLLTTSPPYLQPAPAGGAETISPPAVGTAASPPTMQCLTVVSRHIAWFVLPLRVVSRSELTASSTRLLHCDETRSQDDRCTDRGAKRGGPGWVKAAEQMMFSTTRRTLQHWDGPLPELFPGHQHGAPRAAEGLTGHPIPLRSPQCQFWSHGPFCQWP